MKSTCSKGKHLYDLGFARHELPDNAAVECECGKRVRLVAWVKDAERMSPYTQPGEFTFWGPVGHADGEASWVEADSYSIVFFGYDGTIRICGSGNADK